MTVAVVEFTDPGCPFAYSAEPVRLRLQWRFGDGLAWRTRLVGLAPDRATQEAKGLTPEKMAGALRSFDRHGMPLTESAAPPVPATWPACRAVVAAGMDDPVAGAKLLRRLRVDGLGRGLAIDDQETIDAAVAAVGLDPAMVARRARDPDVEEAFRADLDAARRPGPIALALDHRLADVGEWTYATPGPRATRRYTCPSYVLESHGTIAEVPGFQPWAAVETTVANLVPDLEARPWAEDPLDVLRWSDDPLATVEVAALLGDVDVDEARTRLRDAGAHEERVGTDALWSVAG